MAASRSISTNPSFIEWFALQEQKSTSAKALSALEDRLRKSIRDELQTFREMNVTEYTLFHKHNEIQRWLPSQKKSHIDWVQRNIWRPTGRSDFRRIEPELIFVRDNYQIKSKNIWGDPVSVTIQNKEPHARHWEIMRTLISSGRNDGTIGRALRFIVRDKRTKTYLGVICISSAMASLKCRNDKIGWKNQEEYFYKGSRLANIANGQSIVPTQPFGSAYLGGKLLSLLCLSDVVAKKWEELYGQKLVEVDTTSLWGEMKDGKSQYDNLNPYWDSKLGDTEGDTPFKPSEEIYFQMRDWMQRRFPEEYFRHFVELGATGQPRMRDNKSRAIAFCFRQLGFEKKDYLSNHKRGVYRSCLYTNTDDFLRGEINADDLVPAFNNSVDALTEFWRFGTMGDTRVLSDDVKQKLKNNPQKIASKVKMKGQVKGQIDARDPTHQIPTQGNQVDWYLDLGTMSWQEVREKYLAEVGR